jgi:hypothetical protein
MDAPTSARSPVTSACPRPFRPRAPLAHFPCSLVPSVELSCPSLALRMQPDELRLRSPKTATVPRPSLSPHRACSLGKLRGITHSSGHPSVRPFPLWFIQFVLTEALLAQPESAAVDPRLHRLPTIL